MTLTLFEAAKLSQNPLTSGVLTAIATTDELLSQVPMVPKMGESFVYDREKTLASVEFVAPDHTALAESGSTFDRVTVPMRLIASNVDVMNFAEEQQSDHNAQRAIQIEKKLKALGRLIGQRLITGNYATSIATSAPLTGVTFDTAGPNQDTTRHGPSLVRFILADASLGGNPSLAYKGPGDRTYGDPVDVSANGSYLLKSDNPSKTMAVTVVAASLPGADAEIVLRIASTTNEWDGLLRLCPAAQTIASNTDGSEPDGQPLTLELMDEMLTEKMKVRDNMAWVFPAKMKTAFYALVRALGGAGIETTTLPGVNGPVPTFRGIPILQTDWIPNETKGARSDLLSIFLISLNPSDGFWMATSASGGAENVDIDPRVARVMGVRLRDLGQLEDKDAVRTRVTFYGSAALGSELAVVRASEVQPL